LFFDDEIITERSIERRGDGVVLVHQGWFDIKMAALYLLLPFLSSLYLVSASALISCWKK